MIPPKLSAPRDRAAYLAYFESWLAVNAVRGKMNATRFGACAVGEPSFMTLLRKGVRRFEIETLEKAIKYCEAYRG